MGYDLFEHAGLGHSHYRVTGRLLVGDPYIDYIYLPTNANERYVKDLRPGVVLNSTNQSRLITNLSHPKSLLNRTRVIYLLSVCRMKGRLSGTIQLTCTSGRTLWRGGPGYLSRYDQESVGED